ncbi:MAG: ethylbenzene dehydrogenase-related protein [Planctomycetota bacterium]
MRPKICPVSFLATALMIVFIAGCAAEAEKPKSSSKGVVASYMEDGIGEASPASAAWDVAQEATLPLLTQDLTDPKLVDPTLSEISVKALCDGQSLAIRIEWEDSTEDAIDDGNRFSDAVAIQLPPAPGGEVPDPTMGQADKPVSIHLWKASYERQLELGEWSLQQTFPNATVDHYPFDAAKEGESEKLTRTYTIAVAADNPIAGKRTSSVDDLKAQGFGTLEHMPIQTSTGSGSHQGSRWAVVISRPLSVAGWMHEAGLKPGENTFVAFAIWDGNSGQSGSRKMRTAWVPLRLGESS